MLVACLLFTLTVSIHAKMEGFIVGGVQTDIKKNPHAASLAISNCTRKQHTFGWRCGGTLLNQKILLTAAHCLYPCTKKTGITIHMGDENRNKGAVRSASAFVVHASYDPENFNSDIGMVKLSKPFKLSARISRIAIIANPPYSEAAKIAGWGLIDEKNKTPGILIMELFQKVMKHKECRKIFKEYMTPGTLCATSKKALKSVASGDSGAGLIVRGYILIGIASFKVPHYSEDALIYTDVGFYYNWITYNTETLFC